LYRLAGEAAHLEVGQGLGQVAKENRFSDTGITTHPLHHYSRGHTTEEGLEDLMLLGTQGHSLTH
jgi:hypothetical protein